MSGRLSMGAWLLLICIENFLKGLLSGSQHEITWDAAAMPSGAYVARLCSEETVTTRTLVLVKQEDGTPFQTQRCRG